MRDPHHPIWGLLRLAVICLTLVAVLYANATKFDHTELKAIGEFVGALAALKGVDAALSKRMGGDA